MDLKQGIRRNFARRSASYDRHAGMQRRMAHALLAAVGDFLPRAERILEIGCGTGYLTQLLRQANPAARLVCLDLDVALVEAARRRLGPDPRAAWLVADGETESLGGGSFDLIIANATFQWFSLPAATLARYGRSLNPGGVLAFSTLGPRTFQELGGALAQAARILKLPAPREIPAQGFLDMDAWSALLTRAGFRQTRLVQEDVISTFPSVPEFLRDLRATGATNPRPRPFSPRLLAALISAYHAGYGNNGSIPVTYEVILAVAQKERGRL